MCVYVMKQLEIYTEYWLPNEWKIYTEYTLPNNWKCIIYIGYQTTSTKYLI